MCSGWCLVWTDCACSLERMAKTSAWEHGRQTAHAFFAEVQPGAAWARLAGSAPQKWTRIRGDLFPFFDGVCHDLTPLVASNSRKAGRLGSRSMRLIAIYSADQLVQLFSIEVIL